LRRGAEEYDVVMFKKISSTPADCEKIPEKRETHAKFGLRLDRSNKSGMRSGGVKKSPGTSSEKTEERKR